MKRIQIFFSIVGMLLTGATLTAQTISVRGVVSDGSTGEGIPYASVMVKGTMTGVSSDSHGEYAIGARKGSVLVFSAIGFTTQEVTVSENTIINVVLPVDATALETSVVVGYGTARKVSSLVGSVQVVSSETIKNAPSSSALDNLQGQVAGLSVLTSSGVSGDNSVSMTLHGVGSIGAGSTPLYIIDGVPSTSRAIMAMNPNDIESISVLKDASATSIYGSRAANGVIYITTKAGSFNEKASVQARFQYGTSTLASTTLYKNMMSGSELKDFWVRSGLHTADWIQGNFTDLGYDYDTKWYKYMMNLWVPQIQSDLTVSGGSARVAYYISASQFHQEGFTIGNYYDRYTVRGNIQASPARWLKVGLNMNVSIDNVQQNPQWGSSLNGMSNSMSGGLSYLLNPLYSPYDEVGNEYTPRIPGLNMVNPNYYMDNNPDVYNRYGLNGNAFISIVPVRNLTITSRVGVDGYITLDNWKTEPSYAQTVGGTALAAKSTEFGYQANITNTVEYIWDINNSHKLTFLLGQEGISYDYSYYYAYSTGQTDDRMLLLQQGTQSTYTIYDSYSQYRFLSFFGHIDYTLLGRYYFDVVIRNDASSRFGSAQRNAQFWSVGAKWDMKKENFLKNVKAIDNLNIKVTYGTQGNAEIGNYASLGIIGSSGTYQEAAGRTLTQPANERLTWEKQGLLTAGFDIRLADMVGLGAEFYWRKTSSMLMSVPTPYTTGFSTTTDNVGSLRNSGVDLTLDVDILRGRDYFLRFSATFNYNDQRILSLFDGRQRWEVANTGVAYVVGSPIMFYYPIYAGIDPEDGRPMWYLPGDDVDVCTKDPSRTTKTFDEDALTQNTGRRRYAPMNGGFSIGGSWKGISLQADFSYVLGKYLISNDGYFYANPNQFSSYNQIKDVTDFWTPSNRDAKWPDWSSGAVMQFDSHLIENASFLRLKNLQVGYSFPQRLLNWSGGVLKGIKITFTGRNILTCTKYTGIDPEVNSNLSYGKAGNSKQFLGGIELTF
ncbi:MAG: SusC/RagA family TonB-linked outer membrane protein [Bacteroidales bacterium]|nr:SusC/RagA family TonB-linked outer membrane protein [Bacteroidales bacterium]